MWLALNGTRSLGNSFHLSIYLSLLLSLQWIPASSMHANMENGLPCAGESEGDVLVPKAGWAGNLQSSGHFCGLGTSAHVPPHSPLHTLPTSHLKLLPYLCPCTYSFCLEKAELESSTMGTRTSSSDSGSQRASPQARF